LALSIVFVVFLVLFLLTNANQPCEAHFLPEI
jgi:hypothetical protein